MINPAPLRISSLKKEVPFQASLWLNSQVLLDEEEMQALFSTIGTFYIYLVSGVRKINDERISQEEFLSCYSQYISALKNGQIPEESLYRLIFSSIFTASPDHLYAVPVGENQQLIRICKPIIQLQVNRVNYSLADGKFYPMVFGANSILWGIQFAYPQLYLNIMTKQVEQVRDNPDLPNTQLFKNLQRWIRYHTIPTPFFVNDKRINVPFRLGKNCLSWINKHPQLVDKQIQVIK